MLSSPFSPWRTALSPKEALGIAREHLENARKATGPNIALTYCDDAKSALSRVRRSVRKALRSSSSTEDRTLCNGIADVYFGLGDLMDSLKNHDRVESFYTSGEKWRGHGRDIQLPGQSSSVEPTIDPAVNSAENPTVNPIVIPSVDVTICPLRAHPHPLSPCPIQDYNGFGIAQILPHIFKKDMDQPPDINKLPAIEERLESITQLVHCLDLLRSSQSLDDALDQTERSWLIAIEHDPEEQERLRTLATNILREFAREELKDLKAVAEVVCLVPILSKDDLQQLLQRFFHGIEQSKLLDFNLLEGLAQLVQHAVPGHLNADNLVKILELISTRLKDTHQQSPDYICQLTITVSHVLDAMADSKVKGLDREQLHAPLAAYLHGLQGNTDPYVVYQAAYASQALLYVPDDETPWQATMRRTGKVVKGVSGVVSAVKGLDLNGFVEGLSHIQEGLSGASQVFLFAKNAYEDVTTLAKSGQQFLDCLKESLSISRKRAWYPALRCADVLLQNGQLIEFERLVCEAPCRLDPAFQWGICQRLGELAANAECDDDSRTSAITFLREMYQNDTLWGQVASIKQRILDIIMQLATPSGGAMQAAETLLEKLENDGNAKKDALYRSCREEGPSSHPLKVALPLPLSPSLLDRVQNKIDVEGSLRQLRMRRLEDRSKSVYISPQAKANLLSLNDTLFPLMDKIKEFLDSNQQVFLLLGDSGAGKSTFKQQLEYDLWSGYKRKETRIPLFITLAVIQNPEHDLIGKHLRNEGFTEPQIRELKGYHEFILICDGYDETRQTHNLYTTNRLNQRGEWRAQMVISCRSEYLGVDYRDLFQPVDRNYQANSTLFQQAVIAPFSKDQIEDYVNQFVSVESPLWQASDYIQALDRIPGLKDLVTNPFLLSLSLEVLPRMVDPRQNLSAARITRVALYDKFVDHWLERGKKRLVEQVNDRDRKSFKKLSDEGFTLKCIEFLKQLAMAIFDNQAGNSIIDYSTFRDQATWKEPFFGQDDEKKLLLEACPLNRSGNQYRFLHRSLLEYSLARAVFEPQEGAKDGMVTEESTTAASRRGSVSSTYSFESQETLEEVEVAVEQPVLESPLGRKNFVGEPSILRFLVERVQQEALFKRQLLAVIERSKTEQKGLETVRRAATNAITILVRAGVQFNGADLRGIQIPGADLSHGVFDCVQLQGADMRKVALRSVWLRGADLSGAQMAGVQFGELPFLQEESAVVSCVYSPDGRTFTNGLDNGIVTVYTTSNWEKLATLHGHSDSVFSILYSPKGDQIASGSSDMTVRLWDVETGDCLHVLKGHSDKVQSIAYSPKGDLIASGSDDKTVRLWDVETGYCRHIMRGHDDQIQSITYSPTGYQIASGSNDATIRLWDVESGDCRHTLSGHRDWVRSITYSPKGDQIASGSEDKTLRLWDVETGDCRRTLIGHSDGVFSIVYSPKGNQIASGSYDKTVRLWDVETGDGLHILSGHSDLVKGIAYSPKGDQIASSSNDAMVRLWDVETGDCRHTLSGHSGWVQSIAYSPRGDQISSGSLDKTVRLWDVKTGDCRDTLSGHGEIVQGVAYSPKSNRIASGSDDKTVRLWDTETGGCHLTLSGHSKGVQSIAYSPKGDHIVSGSEDKTVRLWDVETGDCRHALIGHDKSVESVAYSPKGDQIASGSVDKTVRLWDVDTGNCRRTLNGHSNSVHSISYSPEGTQIASGSDDKTVRLWDAETGNCLHVLSGHRKSVRNIAYSPRGDKIASGSDDKTARLWDVETGDCRHTLRGHSKAVRNIAYSPKGDQIASGSEDKTVRLWDVETGECRHTLSGHRDWVRTIVYSPAGDQIASGSDDLTVRLWDVTSGQCRVTMQNYAMVSCISWKIALNSDCLVVGCTDGSVLQWQVLEKGNACYARLSWRSPLDVLTLADTSMEDVQGLSRLNRQLFKQRGAVGVPS